MSLSKIIFAVFIACYSVQTASAQLKLPSTIKKVSAPASGQPSADEIANGIKEALVNGVSNSASRLSAANGFLNHPSIKIPFPTEAQKAEKTLRSLGFNSLCDNVINSINHAAEDAAKEALPIFMNAVKQMSMTDARNLLLSKQQDAATQFFKNTTTSQLTDKFKPIIQASLEKTGATKYWSTAVAQYNKVPMTTKVNTDLTAYVTDKALAGLFYEIAQEESKIRTTQSLRTSPLLQKVFEFSDKELKRQQ